MPCNANQTVCPAKFACAQHVSPNTDWHVEQAATQLGDISTLDLPCIASASIHQLYAIRRAGCLVDSFLFENLTQLPSHT